MSTSWIIILIFLAFLIFGTSGPTAQRPDVVTIATVEATARIDVEINDNPGVILPADTYRDDADNWTPTVDELQAAEDAVAVAAPLDGRDPVLDGYRQYAGIMENGERKIIINSMCQEFEGWDETFIMTADGGPCFWEAIYNADTGELENLIVNGGA